MKVEDFFMVCLFFGTIIFAIIGLVFTAEWIWRNVSITIGAGP